MPACRAAAGTRVINYPGNFLLPDGYPGSEYLICRIYLIGFSEIVHKNIKQTYKGAVICCTNKCTINERCIQEHQNKLNIYDLQNCDFFANFFNRKNSKIR